MCIVYIIFIDKKFCCIRRFFTEESLHSFLRNKCATILVFCFQHHFVFLKKERLSPKRVFSIKNENQNSLYICDKTGTFSFPKVYTILLVNFHGSRVIRFLKNITTVSHSYVRDCSTLNSMLLFFSVQNGICRNLPGSFLLFRDDTLLFHAFFSCTVTSYLQILHAHL